MSHIPVGGSGRRGTRICPTFVDSRGFCKDDCPDVHPSDLGSHLILRARQRINGKSSAQIFTCPRGHFCKLSASNDCSWFHGQDVRPRRPVSNEWEHEARPSPLNPLSKPFIPSGPRSTLATSWDESRSDSSSPPGTESSSFSTSFQINQPLEPSTRSRPSAPVPATHLHQPKYSPGPTAQATNSIRPPPRSAPPRDSSSAPGPDLTPRTRQLTPSQPRSQQHLYPNIRTYNTLNGQRFLRWSPGILVPHQIPFRTPTVRNSPSSSVPYRLPHSPRSTSFPLVPPAPKLRSNNDDRPIVILVSALQIPTLSELGGLAAGLEGQSQLIWLGYRLRSQPELMSIEPEAQSPSKGQLDGLARRLDGRRGTVVISDLNVEPSNAEAIRALSKIWSSGTYVSRLDGKLLDISNIIWVVIARPTDINHDVGGLMADLRAMPELSPILDRFDHIIIRNRWSIMEQSKTPTVSTSMSDSS